MSNIFKIKINGMKRKVRILEDNEILQEGDYQFTGTKEDGVNLLKENSQLNGLFQTCCVGDKVSDYPKRFYIRVLSF